MRLARGLPVFPALALLAGCGGDYPQSSVAPVTDFAHVIQGLYTSVFWWTMIILAVVWVALAVTLVKFRDRPGRTEPRQIHGHLGLEIGWTIGPALIVVAIAIPTIQAVFATQARDADGAYVVDVVGHQFWWEFRYPEGVVTANELHLPVGQPISLRMHSVDVIHSFWVPQMGGKRDVNPLVAAPEGREPRYNWLHFTLEEEGTFMGQCAEFCGPSHSLMGVRVVSESEDAFQSWLTDWRGGEALPPPGGDSLSAADSAADVEAAASPAADSAAAVQAAAPPAADSAPAMSPQLIQQGQAPDETTLVDQGREVFHNATCIACHAIQGTNAQGQVAPNLTLVGRRGTIAAGWLDNTPEDLKRWITAPHSVKPGSLMPGVAEAGGGWPATNLSEDQVEAVAAYLSSLR